MKIEPTILGGVVVLHPEEHRDERGLFAEAVNIHALADKGISFKVDQVNVSMSVKAGTVRGMHYQEHPFGQKKLVRCLNGEVLDVIVDVMPDSPTYGRWKAVRLEAGDLQSVLIPQGFAHGWQALEDFSQIEYLVSGPWKKDAERGVRPDDPSVGIVWPKTIVAMNSRDSSWPLFSPSSPPGPSVPEPQPGHSHPSTSHPHP